MANFKGVPDIHKDISLKGNFKLKKSTKKKFVRNAQQEIQFMKLKMRKDAEISSYNQSRRDGLTMPTTTPTVYGWEQSMNTNFLKITYPKNC